MGHFKSEYTNRLEDERLARETSPVKSTGHVGWSKERIQQLLEVNDQAVGRALLRLLEGQTDDEQAQETTKYFNGRGFMPFDARKMTGMAKFFKARGFLTERQLGWLRGGKNSRFHSRIGKYAGQLLTLITN